MQSRKLEEVMGDYLVNLNARKEESILIAKETQVRHY
jgi:hypothetical protein